MTTEIVTKASNGIFLSCLGTSVGSVTRTFEGFWPSVLVSKSWVAKTLPAVSGILDCVMEDGLGVH